MVLVPHSYTEILYTTLLYKFDYCYLLFIIYQLKDSWFTKCKNTSSVLQFPWNVTAFLFSIIS